MKLKYQAALLTAALALGSCSSDDLFGKAGSALGSVYKPGVEVSNVENVIKDGGSSAKNMQSRATYDISNYIVEFYQAGDTDPYSTYVYRDMPGTVELPAGSYSVKVRSHNVQKAEWDRPYFTGESQSFDVKAGEFTEVAPVKCTFASLKVSILFSDELRQAMGDDVEVTVIANDEGKLVYTPSETRAGYFEALNGSVSLVATFTGTVNGHKEEFTRAFDKVDKGQHRIITYTLGAGGPVPPDPEGNVGGDGISIDMSYTDETLDGSVDLDGEDVIDDGTNDPSTGLPPVEGDKDPDKDPEQPGNPDDPKPADPINFDGGTLKDGQTYYHTELSAYTVQMNVEKGVADLVVKIESEDGLTKDVLEGVTLTDEFSLVHDDSLFEALGGLGFPVGDDVTNKTKIDVDITSFMTLLEALNGGNNTNVFTMTVTDTEGNVKSLSFTIICKL